MALPVYDHISDSQDIGSANIVFHCTKYNDLVLVLAFSVSKSFLPGDLFLVLKATTTTRNSSKKVNRFEQKMDIYGTSTYFSIHRFRKLNTLRRLKIICVLCFAKNRRNRLHSFKLNQDRLSTKNKAMQLFSNLICKFSTS